MQIPFLNPGAQFKDMRVETLAAVEAVLAGGHYILGPNVSAFEIEIAARLGAGFAVGVNSGSDALTLALRALEIGPGDEVITSPFTYIAPAEAIHQVGARIVFADVDPSTFCIDPSQVARRITSKTKAILPIHLFGQGAAIVELLDLASKQGLAVIEDCAQAIGAKHNAQCLGTFGPIGCFSFYPTKNLGADGDGGLCVTHDEGLARRLKMLRVHGIEKRYHHELHGVPTTMAELQKTVAVTINFLRQRLNKLVETDVLQITKLPAAGKTTHFTNHYSLSDSIIAETIALRHCGSK